MQHAKQGKQVEARHLQSKMAGVSDIVERLRNWRTVHLARLHLLMEEAADEMERLRLTADEREAVAYYLGTGGPYNVDRTLVALLQRLK